MPSNAAITPTSFNINENTDTSSGTSVGTLSATDEDAGETFTYSIQGGADQLSFTIGGASSDELILTDGILDHGSQDTYTVIVRVTDSGGLTDTQTLTIDFNDASVQFLRSALLRITSSPSCLKIPEGRRFLSFIISIDESLMKDVHQSIRVQIPLSCSEQDTILLLP